MTVYLLHVCRSSGRPMEDVRLSEWSTGGRELPTQVLGAELRSSVTDKPSLWPHQAHFNICTLSISSAVPHCGVGISFVFLLPAGLFFHVGL